MKMLIEEKPAKPENLDLPVVITITTVDELEWMHHALSSAVHLPGVHEDSLQKDFYGAAHVALNRILARYRGRT